MEQGREWSFTLDEDGPFPLVVAVAPEGTPENVRLAVETFIIPFGLKSRAVDNGLRVWRELESEQRTGYSMNTPSASVRRVSASRVALEDMWGQFEDCLIDADEFVGILMSLSAYLKAMEKH